MLQYQKTHCKRHILCIGQNKKYHRWKLTAPIDQKINPQENEIDTNKPDMVFLDYPESQTSVLESIPLRNNLQHPSKGVLESIPQRQNQYPLKVFTVDSPGYSNDAKKLTRKVDYCENITAHLPDENFVEAPSLNDQHSQLQPDLSPGELKKRKRMKCIINKLRDPIMLEKLVTNLDEHNVTKDFLFSIKN